MQQEILLHSMLSQDFSLKQLEDLREDLKNEAVRSQVSGCVLIHTTEVVQYISGTSQMIDDMSEILERSGCFTLIKKLHEGIREDDCLGMWDFVDLSSRTNNSDLTTDEFIGRLQLAKGASVGLKLFASISEIVLSEKLYGLE